MAVARPALGAGSNTKLLGGQPCDLDACPDLVQRRLPRRRRVVSERRKAAIVAGALLTYRDELGCLQHAIFDLVGGLDPLIDRVDDAHEDSLVRLRTLLMMLSTRGRSCSLASWM
ncbi:MAG TPA: hypothetical protein VHF25_08565 [Nitriliruptorales bacterium]|nr:hypothetical protein [Nitriliruptorales bacterium]